MKVSLRVGVHEQHRSDVLRAGLAKEVLGNAARVMSLVLAIVPLQECHSGAVRTRCAELGWSSAGVCPHAGQVRI